MTAYEKGKHDAYESCRNQTGAEAYQPPYPLCDEYSKGWMAGCVQWDAEQAEA